MHQIFFVRCVQSKRCCLPVILVNLFYVRAHVICIPIQPSDICFLSTYHKQCYLSTHRTQWYLSTYPISGIPVICLVTLPSGTSHLPTSPIIFGTAFPSSSEQHQPLLLWYSILHSFH